MAVYCSSIKEYRHLVRLREISEDADYDIELRCEKCHQILPLGEEKVVYDDYIYHRSCLQRVLTDTKRANYLKENEGNDLAREIALKIVAGVEDEDLELETDYGVPKLFTYSPSSR